MRSLNKTKFLLGSALALLPVAPSLAQQTAQGPVVSGLEEIVVTARKREESAQNTPLSLTVSSGETLRKRSITQFIELQQQTPSLHIAPSALSGTTTNLSMRGQALVDIRLGIDPTIAVYQDGVYMPRAQGSNAAEMIDIQRVEVLSGPQGTLYGKNSTGGALSTWTNVPTDKFEGLVRGRYGNYGDHSLSAVLNVPLSPQFGIRVVGNISGRDGYGTNTTLHTRNGESDSNYFRATALWTPSDDLKVTLRGDYVRTKSTREAWAAPAFLAAPTAPGAGLGSPLITVEAAMEMNNIPSTAAWLALPAATKNAMVQAADAYIRGLTALNPQDSVTEAPFMEDMRVWGGSGTIDYNINDTLSFKSITGYRAFVRYGTTDLDGTPFTIIEYPYMKSVDRQFSEEAQLSGNFLDGRLKSIAGVYYSNEHGRERIWQTSVRIISGANPTTYQYGIITNKSFGLFTQHTYNITDQLSVTGGLRWNKDDRFLTASVYNNTNCGSLGIPLATLGGTANCVRPMETHYKKLNYTAGFEYKATPDMLLYVTTRRGYRSGGLQATANGTTVAAADAANVPFRPEVITDYEGGIKAEWLDHRLRTNVTYYHSNIKDAIRTVSAPVPGSTTTATRSQNAASVKVDGVEFEMTALPVPEIELTLNGAYTDGRFSSYITPVGEDRSGLPLLFTPKWQIGASAAYTAQMSFGQWRTQLDYSWTDRQLSAEVAGYSPAHGILNARTSVTWESVDLEAALYMKNVTNRQYLTYPVDLAGSLGFIYGSIYNPPRTYGIELTKKF